jgi:hypothetical protein
MQLYFFHLVKGDEIIEDCEGSKLPNIEAALREAELALRELVAHAILAQNDNVPELIVLADEGGRAIDWIDLSAVLPRRLRA